MSVEHDNELLDAASDLGMDEVRVMYTLGFGFPRIARLLEAENMRRQHRKPIPIDKRQDPAQG